MSLLPASSKIVLVTTVYNSPSKGDAGWSGSGKTFFFLLFFAFLLFSFLGKAFFFLLVNELRQMTEGDADEKEKARPEKKEMPERIPDTPENIMRALVETPPRKTTDWEYLKAEPPKLLQQQVREE